MPGAPGNPCGPTPGVEAEAVAKVSLRPATHLAGLFRERLVDMIYVEVSRMGYTVILEQEPDGGYVVHAPALPGCVSQGDTRAEALANIREAMELYIEDCIEAGDPVPKEVGREFIEVEAGS
jgi:predicted RNase H-like HicB family nuclease